MKKPNIFEYFNKIIRFVYFKFKKTKFLLELFFYLNENGLTFTFSFTFSFSFRISSLPKSFISL